MGDALLACEVTSPREAGHLSRRLEGVTLHGYRLDRLHEHRDGIVWRVTCEL